VLATLRARLESAHLGWLVEDRFAGLLADHPHLDRLHVFERRGGGVPGRWWRAARLAARLRRERYDVALDLQGNWKSGLWARASGAGRVVGLDRPWAREGSQRLLTERVTPPAGTRHRVDAGLALVGHLLGAGPAAAGRLPGAPVPHGAIVLHPGASRFGAFKRWPIESYAELAGRLHARTGADFLVTAGPGEEDDAQALLARMRVPAKRAPTPSLAALVAVLGGARLVVAADTGPAHIAAVAGAPTVTLFGPKDPDVLAPRGPRAVAVREGVRCSPCALRWCPDPVCMTGLAVDRVERAALALLDGAGT